MTTNMLKRIARGTAPLLAALLFAHGANGAERRLLVLSLNDLHSQMLPVATKVHTTTVLYGGVAHAAGVIAEQKEAAGNVPVLVLQAGDAVAGLMWRLFRGEPEFAALDHIGVRAGTLGNHEFSYGAEHLKEGLAHTSMRMVSANLEFDDDVLGERIEQHALLQAGEVKVGVFGLASPNLFALASAGETVRVDRHLLEISRETVEKLRRQGADIVILLSRLTFEQNIRIAETVDGMHAILGGAGHEELHETLIVDGPNGWKTVLGKAGAYGSFVGRLKLVVEEGRLKEGESEWGLLRVTPRTAPDERVLSIALEYERKLNEAMLHTAAVFSGNADARAQTVRTREAALGNLITDALRHCMKTDIAVINAGGIRSDRVIPAGSVSLKTLAEILPYDNEIHIVTVTGEELLRAFEISASALVGEGDDYQPFVRTHSGGFLQISGARVVYSLAGRPTLIDADGRVIEWGNRVRSLLIEREGEWMPVEVDSVYTVAANSWTATGGDRYSVFRDAPQEKTGIKDLDIFLDHVSLQPGGLVPLELDGRIRIEER